MIRRLTPTPLARIAPLAVALALLTNACVSTQLERRPDATPRTTSGDVTLGALAGSWRAGQEHLLLTMEGVYTWERVLACDLPPCPVNQTSGTFDLRGRDVTLATLDGKGHVLTLALASDPRRLTVRSDKLGQSWTLRYED